MAAAWITPEQEQQFRDNPNAFVWFIRIGYEKAFSNFTTVGLVDFKFHVDELFKSINAKAPVPADELSSMFKEITAKVYAPLFKLINERAQNNVVNLTSHDYMMGTGAVAGFKGMLNLFKPKKFHSKVTEKLYNELNNELEDMCSKPSEFQKNPQKLTEHLTRQTQEFEKYKLKFKEAQNIIKARLLSVVLVASAAEEKSNAPVSLSPVSPTQVLPSQSALSLDRNNSNSSNSNGRASQLNFTTERNKALALAQRQVVEEKERDNGHEQGNGQVPAQKGVCCSIQ